MRWITFSLCGFLLMTSGLIPSDAQAQAVKARPLNIVAFGDSLTAGYGLPSQAALPDVLEKILTQRGLNINIINAGVSGDTSLAGQARLDWSVPANTDGVILALGANDMLRGLDPAETRKTLDNIIVKLKGRNIPVMLAGMKAAPNLGADYVQKFDTIYPDLATKYNLVFYPFLLDGVAGQKTLNIADGVHPSIEGVKLIAQKMAPSVEQFIKTLPKNGAASLQ